MGEVYRGGDPGKRVCRGEEIPCLMSVGSSGREKCVCVVCPSPIWRSRWRRHYLKRGITMMSNVGGVDVSVEPFLVGLARAKAFGRLDLLLGAGHFRWFWRGRRSVYLIAHLSGSLWWRWWWHPRCSRPRYGPRLSTVGVVWRSFATLPMLVTMGMGCAAGLGRRRQIVVTKLKRCIHPLEIVTLFIDVAPHFVVDLFTAADKTEIFCLTDD